jgi:hypothetical protein
MREVDRHVELRNSKVVPIQQSTAPRRAFGRRSSYCRAGQTDVTHDTRRLAGSSTPFNILSRNADRPAMLAATFKPRCYLSRHYRRSILYGRSVYSIDLALQRHTTPCSSLPFLLTPLKPKGNPQGLHGPSPPLSDMSLPNASSRPCCASHRRPTVSPC